jgi:hypothetical protein
MFSGVTLLDGHIGVDFDSFTKELKTYCPQTEFIDISRYYKSQQELDHKFAEYLPEDPEIDPVSLFGRVFEGEISELFDLPSLEQFKSELKQSKTPVVI